MDVMSDSTTLTLRIDSAVKERLEDLARLTKRSKSSLAAEGIEAFVELEERQIEGIRKAIASLDHGAGVPHEKVADWVASWETEDELPTPKGR